MVKNARIRAWFSINVYIRLIFQGRSDTDPGFKNSDSDPVFEKLDSESKTLILYVAIIVKNLSDPVFLNDPDPNPFHTGSNAYKIASFFLFCLSPINFS